MSAPLWEYVVERNQNDFRKKLRQLARDHHASVADVETLKRIANPTALEEPAIITRETLLIGYFLSGYGHVLPVEARVALVALGFGNDAEVVRWIIEGASFYIAHPGWGGFYRVDFFLLLTLENESALAAIAEISEKAQYWCSRLVCLWRLSLSKSDDDSEVVESFKRFILNTPATQDVGQWRALLSCLDLNRIREMVDGYHEIPMPTGYLNQPLIDWAVGEGRTAWLMKELGWLHDHGSYDQYFLRDQLVKKGVPAAVDYCYEQIKAAHFEDHTHRDVIENALKHHPRPLSPTGLAACLEVIRHPSHPSDYHHRIVALKLLVEAADGNVCDRDEVRDLVLDLVQAEADPDVRAAAIALVRWAEPLRFEESLKPALSHEAERVREAAKRALT